MLREPDRHINWQPWKPGHLIEDGWELSLGYLFENLVHAEKRRLWKARDRRKAEVNAVKATDVILRAMIEGELDD